jgi:hypothetical protein
MSGILALVSQLVQLSGLRGDLNHRREGHDVKIETTNGCGSYGDTGAAPPRTVEHRPSRDDLRAFDPLSPIVRRPVRDGSSRADLMALDPLGPIPRFNRAR